MSNAYDLDNISLKEAFDLLDYKVEGRVDVQEVLNNLEKLGYAKTHPEIYDLIEALGEGKVNYTEFQKTITELMNQKEEDTGLQRMYDLLVFNPKLQTIDYQALKQICAETGHPLTEFEINFLLKTAGDGRQIPIESFIQFMKTK